MSVSWTHHVVAGGITILLLGLSQWWRWEMVSLAPWIVTLSILFAFTYRQSLAPLLFLLVVGELFSFLPPGIVGLMVIIPYAMHRFLAQDVRLWSGALWITIGLTVGAQLLVGVAGYVWGEELLSMTGMADFWQAISWNRLGAQWVVATIVTGIGVGVWQETSPGEQARPLA